MQDFEVVIQMGDLSDEAREEAMDVIVGHPSVGWCEGTMDGTMVALVSADNVVAARDVGEALVRVIGVLGVEAEVEAVEPQEH